MSNHSEVSVEILSKEIEILQAERNNYVVRIAPLLGNPEHRDEINGYLRLIENVNLSITNLAKLVEGALPGARPSQMAA